MNNSIHPIEGDYLETKKDNFLFDVKGLRHPKDRTICFLRFVPHLEGGRKRNGVSYKKIYDLQERYSYLQENYPKYLFYSQNYDLELQGVLNEDIKNIFTPNECLLRLKKKSNPTKAQEKSVDLCNLLMDEGGIGESSIGITGSQMVNLNKEDSDIDLVIYGTDTSERLQEVLPQVFDDANGCRKYTFEEFKDHYQFRAGGSGVSFNDFMKSESRKLHQGMFQGYEFFIRYIKSPEDWRGKYYDYQYKNFGRVQLKAQIFDASDSLFTPCSYKIKTNTILNRAGKEAELDPEVITEVSSYRGRFCEHAEQGDMVMVEGKLEQVRYKNEDPYYRVLLGNQKSDKMIIISN
jgi:predicted nucleotidyltransferase